jgi:hypothetical protein
MLEHLLVAAIALWVTASAAMSHWLHTTAASLMIDTEEGVAEGAIAQSDACCCDDHVPCAPWEETQSAATLAWAECVAVRDVYINQDMLDGVVREAPRGDGGALRGGMRTPDPVDRESCWRWREDQTCINEDVPDGVFTVPLHVKGDDEVVVSGIRTRDEFEECTGYVIAAHLIYLALHPMEYQDFPSEACQEAAEAAETCLA